MKNGFLHQLLFGFVVAFFPAVVNAQVSLEAQDGNGSPVPYAHIVWRSLVNAELSGLTVLDGDGKGTLVVDRGIAASGLVLKVSFVGFRALNDTIYPSVGERSKVTLVKETFGLPEFVVTGQYAPSSPEKAVHRIRVLDAAQFKRMAANNLGDALRNELNIRLSQDNILGTSMSMQGLGGQNVKLLIDGVPMIGRQDGNIDLAQIDLTGIERAEIIEGPLSVNYGTNALAGTINLITRKGGGKPATLKAAVYAEHIGRLNTTLSATRHWGNNDLVFTAGRNFFAGWDPSQSGFVDLAPSLADSTRFQQWKPREQYFGRLSYRWSKGKWDLGYKGEAMHDRITNRGRPRAPFGETAFDERYTTIRLDNSVTFERRFSPGTRIQGQVAYNRYTRYRNTWFRDLTTLGEELVDTEGMQDTSVFTLSNVRMVFAHAPDSSKVNFEAGIDLNLETGAGQRIEANGKEIGDYAVFASLEYKPITIVTLRPGLRYAYNTRYGAPLIPSLNVRWQLSNGFTVRGSYARGFRAPSLKELYFFFVDVNHDIVGNGDLAAERSHNMSGALSYRHSKAKGVYTSELGVFYNVVEDLITLAQINATRYTYINVGQYKTLGGSIGAGWDNGHWIISTGAAVTGRYDELAAANDEPYLFSPEVRASLTKQWLRKGWSASVFWKWQGRLSNYVAGDDDELGRSFISPFSMADASLTKRVAKDRLAITVGCKDLFNVRNVNASLSGGAHSAAGATVPMTTGRTAFLRIELDLARNSK